MSEENIDHSVDRAGWPSGEWDSEPDREEWRSHGFPCLIVRNNLGGLCGYVGVPPGHPFHGKDYDAVDVEVHGGLTYADVCAGHICHVPREGEPAEVYWLGFDCGHAHDIMPSLLALRQQFDFESHYGEFDSYRTMAYVRAEVENLAKQIAERGGSC